jgi:uncharacterized protein (DUF427 family)
MALTIGKSPLARPPGGAFNFDIEQVAPEHILYLEDVPKRIRGVLAGETIVDTRRAKMLHETGEFAQWYVPIEDVRSGALEVSERRENDPFKGEATYYNVRAGDRTQRDAAWSYGRPTGLSLTGFIAFDFDKLDKWLEEDDEIAGHPRDPYHRFDCRHSTEHVVVSVGGEMVAETHRAIKLFETSTTVRYYIPLDDVKPGVLTPTDTRTFCPYKGEAAYYDVRAGATIVRDGAWTLPNPLGEADVTRNHVSFWRENTEVLADGHPVPV